MGRAEQQDDIHLSTYYVQGTYRAGMRSRLRVSLAQEVEEGAYCHKITTCFTYHILDQSRALVVDQRATSHSDLQNDGLCVLC